MVKFIFSSDVRLIRREKQTTNKYKNRFISFDFDFDFDEEENLVRLSTGGQINESIRWRFSSLLFSSIRLLFNQENAISLISRHWDWREMRIVSSPWRRKTISSSSSLSSISWICYLMRFSSLVTRLNLFQQNELFLRRFSRWSSAISASLFRRFQRFVRLVDQWKYSSEYRSIEINERHI